MPRLIVAEKPSVARDLAKILGANSRGQGHLKGGGWLITWCVGHLVELVEPAAYTDAWKRWSMDTLPMTPEVFKLQAVTQTQDQFEVVKRLLLRQDVTDVINACDAGREGELIFRYVFELSGAKKPIQRLWISSMTDEAIEAGMANLKSGEDYDRLWDAARCRSEADWLVGLNATRAITVLVRQALGPGRGGPLFSVGRVQTPTLALVVRREQEIENFTPKDYWLLDAYFQAEAGAYKGRWFKGKKDRFDKLEDVEALKDGLLGEVGLISKVEKKKAIEKPPFLFDLTTLQRVANKRFGLSAANTLKIAQSLYENHKCLTYPRTDSSFLSNDMYKELPKVMRTLDGEDYGAFVGFLREQGKLAKTKRVFDDKKVTDHHAIIPTPKRPNFSRFSTEERKVYDLVVRRFLAAFFPDAQFEKTTIVTKVKRETFRTRGKVVVDPGWRRVEGWTQAGPKSRSKGEGDEDNNAVLPPVQKGQEAQVEKLEVLTKQTKPPSRYTEATLLAAMEGAGKTLEDDALKAAMKDSGLGTPATRAGTIETLLFRRYIIRSGKSLKPLNKGTQLINVLPVEDLKSAQLTGDWEARLARMARAEEGESAKAFREDVQDYLRDMVERMKKAPLKELAAAATELAPDLKAGKKGKKKGKPIEVPNSIHSCPRCGGGIMAAPKVFACRGDDGRSHGCGVVLFRTVASRPLSEEEALALLKQGQTEVLTGFVSKKGNNFEARLKLTEDLRVVFDFPPRENRLPRRPPARETLGTCPLCGKGQIIRGKTAYGCNAWKDGCTLRLPVEVEGIALLGSQLSSLLSNTAAPVPLEGGVKSWKLELVDGHWSLLLKDEGEED